MYSLCGRRAILLAAGILSGMILMTPAGASAQFDDVLRNVMQNAAGPAARIPAYPPLCRPAYPLARRILRLRFRTRNVAELQRMLDDLGYDAGPADGGWGRKPLRR